MTSVSPKNVDIDRHKAAIVRIDISRPVKTALESGVLSEVDTFFDYGCGHGGDIERIKERGIVSEGWDPHYRPDAKKRAASIVNLGYILNVIESLEERQQVLKEAWSLTEKALLVSAQVVLNYLNSGAITYGDGVITRRNTFQKYYEQDELKNYIHQVLGVEPIPAGLGIFFVFRNEKDAESFRLSRFHSKRRAPKSSLTSKKFDDFKDLLQPLMDFYAERGRLPISGELSNEDSIRSEFGSLKRAFRVIVNGTSKLEWENLSNLRRDDLLVYFALSNFTKRPKFKEFSNHLQVDVRTLFGSYRKACATADEMLFSLGQEGVVKQKCRESKIGKWVGEALYVHVSALDEIDPLLRLYEGCASRTAGRMDGATIVKFHTKSPKISYLYYPDFDTDAHPALHSSVKIDLQDLKVRLYDYSQSNNPPILHRKETFVSTEYSLYESFQRLTLQEEKYGLLADSHKIGSRRGWLEKLRESGFRIVEHSVQRT